MAVLFYMQCKLGIIRPGNIYYYELLRAVASEDTLYIPRQFSDEYIDDGTVRIYELLLVLGRSNHVGYINLLQSIDWASNIDARI